MRRGRQTPTFERVGICDHSDGPDTVALLCRYYGNCALRCPGSAATCDGAGHVLVAGTDMYDCDTYEPMPDVDALLRIAQVLESADRSECEGCVLEDSGCYLCAAGVEHEIAERIRQAIGR